MELPDSRAFNQREVSARRAIDTQGLASIHPRPHHVGSGGNRRVRFRPQISHQPTPVDEMHEDRAHVPGIVRLPQTALQRRGVEYVERLDPGATILVAEPIPHVAGSGSIAPNDRTCTRSKCTHSG